MKFPLCIFAFFCSFSAGIKAEYSISDPLNLKQYGGDVKVASDDYVTGSIWPKPQVENPSGVIFSLSPKAFTFQINGKTSDVLSQAVERYKTLVFPDSNVVKTASNLDAIESLEIVVVTNYSNMTIESDESCEYIEMNFHL